MVRAAAARPRGGHLGRGTAGSLLGPWLGHLMADVAIFVIGYELAFAPR